MTKQPTTRVQLPRTAAKALVAFAYQGTFSRTSLAKLTLILDRKEHGRIALVAVDLTQSQLEVLRGASVGHRLPGLAALAREVHLALGSTSGYRSGAFPRTSRMPAQTAGGASVDDTALQRRARSKRGVRIDRRSGNSKKWNVVCDKCGWMRVVSGETQANLVAKGHRCDSKVRTQSCTVLLRGSDWIVDCSRCGHRKAFPHRADAQAAASSHSCGRPDAATGVV